MVSFTKMLLNSTIFSFQAIISLLISNFIALSLENSLYDVDITQHSLCMQGEALHECSKII